MNAPFNIVVKIVQGGREIYLNTEQAVRIEITKGVLLRQSPKVVIKMSDGSEYQLEGIQAQQFINRVEGTG